MEHFRVKITHYEIVDGNDTKRSKELLIKTENYTHAEELAHKYCETNSLKSFQIGTISKSNISEYFEISEEDYEKLEEETEVDFYQGKVGYEHTKENGSVKVTNSHYLVEAISIEDALQQLNVIGETEATEDFKVLSVHSSLIYDCIK